MHIPVLLQECLSALSPHSGEFFVDGTLGAGGHALEVLERTQPGGIFLGLDKDPSAVENFQSLITGKYYALEKVLVKNASYGSLGKVLESENLPKVDGLLLDLGFSSEQIKGGKLAGRGFSFSVDEPLLMTYDPKDPPLRDVLPTLSEEELIQIIQDYGEERYGKEIAKAVSKEAKAGKIQTSINLVRAIESAVPSNYENHRISPATRTFQALRIYINQELAELEKILKALPNIINKNGRVAIISFHSLEDRLVKNYFRDYCHASSALATPIAKKPIIAANQEINQNPRSRSAKLRAIKFN
ncbi:MAG: 16S rRNA (cytosine(1402)-N(4))-methyltransferase [Candidatus Harrisonbacteria bacterium CG10_big_fil_rev_8_21_14_0_10_45_28]|uniref:Ribosomal RNA small subunit methyltransferase H n=1 Tax=Candidatus Harrisonbacteria bacterium CG10_big_fil_rev_8_21_14_0_10_45_28 TaxID=1974586 RepID=A0A2H0UR40_9BACT|nr:MAG: 16S rRNA (cytosine(1402)-N(4))-methyltransferase [Candidatus Harrisonbacteria bacterium CG10_big_fil_rev_8_21_14_0_10_45_28]